VQASNCFQKILPNQATAPQYIEYMERGRYLYFIKIPIRHPPGCFWEQMMFRNETIAYSGDGLFSEAVPPLVETRKKSQRLPQP
jgi:hypothetical protein